MKPAAGYRGPLAYSSPEAVQTTGTVAAGELFALPPPSEPDREGALPLDALTDRGDMSCIIEWVTEADLDALEQQESTKA